MREGASRSAQRSRQLGAAQHVEVARVAAEQLVAAIPREGHGDGTPRQFADEIHGDRRRIGERLVEGGDQPVEHRVDVGTNDELGVLGAKRGRDGGRHRGLVERVLVEPDGEGLDAPAASRHEGDDGGGIEAAREEGAERHLRLEVGIHGVDEEATQFTDSVRFGDSPDLRSHR